MRETYFGTAFSSLIFTVPMSSWNLMILCFRVSACSTKSLFFLVFENDSIHETHSLCIVLLAAKSESLKEREKTHFHEE